VGKTVLIHFTLTQKKPCIETKPKRKKTNINESSAFCSGNSLKEKIINHSITSLFPLSSFCECLNLLMFRILKYNTIPK